MKTSTKRTCLIYLMLAAVVCLAMNVAVRGKRASAAATRSDLTLARRVAHQRAIEEVYQRRRVAQATIPHSGSARATAVTTTQIEAKVASYLRKSQALESVWRRPVTGEQLQAEMERIARNTRHPALLRELYQALNNDPFVIAECLARPTLVERQLRDVYARDHGKGRPEAFEQWWAQTEPKTGLAETVPAYSYRLQPIAATVNPCANDTWQPTTLTGAPSARNMHTAVWTGAEMIIWGGSGSNDRSGGRYNPATDSWTSTSLTDAPANRTGFTAVWTGTEMIIWGGDLTNTGARYNPAADAWTPTSTTGAPDGRSQHTAVWTGSEMIIWGGDGPDFRRWNNGSRYNPATNNWTSISEANAPAARHRHTAVWTGAEMIVWGGSAEGLSITNSGGRYNPATNSWTPTSTLGAAGRRVEHTAVWTGTEMIVWGGELSNVQLNTGARYNPVTDSWKGVSMTLPPAERKWHASVWTGTEMIVWGGQDLDGRDPATGGRYNPATDSWTPTSESGAPIGRDLFTAVWTGSEMIVWGGSGGPATNTGGRYCAQPSGPVNAPPDIVGMGITRTAGSPGEHTQIVAVNDTEDDSSDLRIQISGDGLNFGDAATVNGVTVTLNDENGSAPGVNPNATGQVFADVAANCTATSAAFTVRVTDSGNSMATASLTVSISPNTPPALSYGDQVVAAGTTPSFAPTSGPTDNVAIASLALQSITPTTGLALSVNSTTGLVTVISATETRSYNVVIRATDQCGLSTNASFTVNVACPTILLSDLAAGAAGSAYNQTISVNPVGSYTFSVTNGGLPTGLTLNSATGTLSGAPTASGTYNFTVRAQTAGGCAGQRSYALAINCPAIGLSSLPAPSLNTPYNQSITASPAGGNYSFAVTAGALPTGLSLNSATGVVSGTPAVSGSYNFTITATGFGGCTGSRAYSFTIGGGGCPTISLPALANGAVGQMYNQSVAASPSGSYSYAVTAGSLPPGLTLYASGLLFGYPTGAGSYNFTITATGAGACMGSRSYSLAIQ